LAGQRARLHDGARDTTRCRGRAPVTPGNLQESGPRRAVDAARAASHLCLSTSSDNGTAIEEISRLVGHSSSNVTETVYRHQIRPVITAGAEAMDKIFANRRGKLGAIARHMDRVLNL
jgi:integrase